MRSFWKLVKDEGGATAVEYGLIVAMIFLAMIVGVRNFASEAIKMWDHVSNEVQTK
jgi:pilus assembly protein Flp/PilA